MSLFNDPTRILVPVVKIAAFKKVGGGVADLVDSIVAPYDMPSLTSKYANCINADKTAGGDGAVGRFNYSEPSEMALKLLLDDTTYSNLVAYAMPAALIPDSVDKLVTKLFSMCHAIDGDSHQPYFIRVTPLQMPMVNGPSGGFGGFLKSMEVKNEIVDMLGSRVKAKVDLNFTECKTAENSAKAIGRSSPDLTHDLQTYAGDKLINKVKGIYGSSQYVHAVAEFNQLNTVREITPGRSIKFPPLEN